MHLSPVAYADLSPATNDGLHIRLTASGRSMYLASITCPEPFAPDCLVPEALPLGPDGASAPFSSDNVYVRSMLGTFCRRDDMASG